MICNTTNHQSTGNSKIMLVNRNILYTHISEHTSSVLW